MSKAINVSYYDIIRKPIITEKATTAADLGKFVFEVSTCANKIKVKKIKLEKNEIKTANYFEVLD